MAFDNLVEDNSTSSSEEVIHTYIYTYMYMYRDHGQLQNFIVSHSLKGGRKKLEISPNWALKILNKISKNTFFRSLQKSLEVHVYVL